MPRIVLHSAPRQFSTSSLSTSITPSTKQSRPLILVEKIRRLRDGDFDGIPHIGAVRIHRDELDELKALLSQSYDLQDFALYRVKSYYNPKRSCLKYSMPGPIHSAATGAVIKVINEQLSSIAQRHPARRIIGQIVQLPDRTIEPFCDMKGGSKVNDGLWIFKGVMAHRYCLALEVSHSQEYKEVKKKVRTLIAETKGRPALGIIVNININYDSKNDIIAASDPSTALDRTSFIKVTKNGSRRREVQEMVSRQVFIEADGSIIDGQIELSISDIIGSVHLESYKKDPKFNTADELVLGDKVIIPHRALAGEIQDAEASILADWKSRASGGDMGPDGPTYINTDNDTASSSDDSFPSTSSSEKDDKRKDPSYSGKASASSNPSSRGPSSRNAKKT